jgi:putative ABC transport system permease protein
MNLLHTTILHDVDDAFSFDRLPPPCHRVAMTLRTIPADVRFALRMLRRHRTYAATSVATLALGIAATTAVFAVVDAVLLRALPYAAPSQLVGLSSMQRGADGSDTAFALSEIELVRWRAATRTLAAVEGLQPRSLALTGDGDPEVVRGAAVTSGLFQMLGTQPLRGRTFTLEEERANAPLAVIGHRLWLRRFGADAQILGRSIALDGRSYEIVGVMPAGYRPLLDPSEVWIPLNPRVNPAQASARLTAGAGRLQPAATPRQAESELGAISAALAREFPIGHANSRPSVVPLRDQLLGNRRPALVALVAAVAVLLALACANVANLTLGHIASRRSELTVRTLIGAGRAQVVQQLLVQGLLMSAAGAICAVALVVWTLPPIVALYTRPGQPAFDVAIDWRVMVFVTGAMVVTAVMSSVVPAVHAHATGGVAHAATARIGTGRWERRLREALVALQVAFAIVLLCGAGALVTSLARMLGVSPGFRPDGVLTMQLMLAPARYADVPARARVVGRLVDRVAAVPGVVAAGTTQTTFMPNESMQTLMFLDGRTIEGSEPDTANIRHITPGYFRSLLVPIVDGRAIDERDQIGTPPVCVVSAAFARQFWPGQRAIGHRVRRTGATAQWMAVVGVAGDVMDAGAGVNPGPTLYVPYLQVNTATARITLIVRASGDPLAIANAVRQAIWSVDPLQPVDRVGRLDHLLIASAGDERFRTVLVGMFALIGVALALVGVHGVTAAAVASRTREMGVRLALGARPGQLVGEILVETMRRVAVGAGAGALVFTACGRLLKRLLYEAPAMQADVITAAVVVMCGGALLAAYLRARPLAALSPAIVLRDAT